MDPSRRAQTASLWRLSKELCVSLRSQQIVGRIDAIQCGLLSSFWLILCELTIFKMVNVRFGCRPCTQSTIKACNIENVWFYLYRNIQAASEACHPPGHNNYSGD